MSRIGFGMTLKTAKKSKLDTSRYMLQVEDHLLVLMEKLLIASMQYRGNYNTKIKI